MSASGLKLNDPVHVNRDSSSSSSTPVKAGGASTLEGIVACLGPVDFNSDDDWIGVRLTGSSVGLGKNDGTVKGKKYFDCPTSCGMFIKSSAVTKRQLTRLEELKLRRELGSSSSSSSSTTSRTRTTAATTTTTKTKATRTRRTTATTATATTTITPTGT
jgi:dynactin complex subunit